MNLSDKILSIKNKLRAKANLNVTTEGHPDKDFYPVKCNITNKRTDEMWSVEFHSKPYDDPDCVTPVEWCAQLKDTQGTLLETLDIRRYFSDKRTDEILAENSGYEYIWNAVNDQFAKFQKEHKHIIDKRSKMRHNVEIASAMKIMDDFLKR